MDETMETTRGSPEPEKPGYWAVLPASVRYDAKLPDKAKLLYAEISSLTEARGYCYASNAYFMRLYDMAERTLQRHMKALEAAGYIRILDGNGGKARRKIYAGVNPLRNPDKNDGVPANPVKNDGVTPSKLSGGNKNRKEEQYPPKAPQGAGAIWDEEAWERFWQLYPKKRDKAKALQEWNRLKADRKLMQKMSAALRAQMASDEWQRDKGRAVPYPCRWLSHRRWEDELTEAAPPLPTGEEETEWI